MAMEWPAEIEILFEIIFIYYTLSNFEVAQSSWALEYTDCTSADG